MKEVCLISKEEKKELEAMFYIMLSVTGDFEELTADEFDGEENEDKRYFI